jgi:hypothetical protein
MPATSKAPSRKKREDKLDWEELEHAPNVDGMYSFLKDPEPHPRDTLPTVLKVPVLGAAVLTVTEIHRTNNRVRVHRCTRVHDAHTPGEQLLLNTLYELAGNPAYGQKQADGSHLVAVSMAEISERISMHETNVRMNIRSLTVKLALDLAVLEDRKKQSARQYRLYTPEQILERRKQAGYEWVVKNRGVHFVDPASGKPAASLRPSETLPS